MSGQKIKEREREELVLRFFCYAERYLQFRHDVRKFLDNFLKEKNEQAKSDTHFLDDYRQRFNNLCQFVKSNFPSAFQSPGKNLVPRVRFESLAVGFHLALETGKIEIPPDLSWLNDNSKDTEFGVLTRTDASNSAPKMKARIDYVRDKFTKL